MLKYYKIFGIVIYLYYLCNSKREQEIMNTELVINRTTLNGTKWEIVVSNYGASLYMNGKYSGYYFNSLEEAQAHLDEIDERVKNPYQYSAPLDCSSFYGRGSNVYYGD